MTIPYALVIVIPTLLQAGLPRLRLGTLHLRVVEICGWVREHARGVTVHLASSHPGALVWQFLATHFSSPCTRRA